MQESRRRDLRLASVPGRYGYNARMNPVAPFHQSSTMRIVTGIVAGASLALVDNVLFEGEVSPIVIVAMLTAASAGAAVAWGRRAWQAGLLTWAWLPGAHLANVLGLSDTLHPNTYTSIFLLAAFSFVITVTGLAIGCGIRWLCGIEKNRTTA